MRFPPTEASWGKAGGYLVVNVDELDSGVFQSGYTIIFRTTFPFPDAFLFHAFCPCRRRKGLMSGLVGLTFLCVFLFFCLLFLRGFLLPAAILLVVMVAAVSLIC
jgi:hypothetical protein